MFSQIEPLEAVGLVCHHVVLRHPVTEAEVGIEVYTATDSFVEVIREIQRRRAASPALRGYELYEALKISDPF